MVISVYTYNLSQLKVALLNDYHVTFELNFLLDCLRCCPKALCLPEHLPEELHDCEVRCQDHGSIVRLYHLPLPGCCHHQVPA